MNGIDTGAAALQASRIAALTPVGPQGAAGAAQTGVSALATGTAALADTETSTSSSSQNSTQTVLSAVALALDAIIRSGGEATPAVVGRAPLWANPEAGGPAGAPGGAASLPTPRSRRRPGPAKRWPGSLAQGAAPTRKARLLKPHKLRKPHKALRPDRPARPAPQRLPARSPRWPHRSRRP